MKYELDLRNYGYNAQQARDQRGRWTSDGHEADLIKHHAEAATKALSGKDTLGKLRHAATAVAAQAQQHINLHVKNSGVAAHAADAAKHLNNLGKLVTNLRITAHKARQGGKDDSAAKAAYEHYNEIHKDLKGALKKGERTGVVAHHGDGASPAQTQGQKAAAQPGAAQPGAAKPVPVDAEGSPKDADALDHLAGGHMSRSAELTDAARAPGLKDKEVKGISHLADAHRLLGSAHYFTAGNNTDRAKKILDEAELHVSHATQGGLHPTMQRHAHDATAAIGALRTRLRQGTAQAAPAADAGAKAKPASDVDSLMAHHDGAAERLSNAAAKLPHDDSDDEKGSLESLSRGHQYLAHAAEMHGQGNKDRAKELIGQAMNVHGGITPGKGTSEAVQQGHDQLGEGIDRLGKMVDPAHYGHDVAAPTPKVAPAGQAAPAPAAPDGKATSSADNHRAAAKAAMDASGAKGLNRDATNTLKYLSNTHSALADAHDAKAQGQDPAPHVERASEHLASAQQYGLRDQHPALKDLAEAGIASLRGSSGGQQPSPAPAAPTPAATAKSAPATAAKAKPADDEAEELSTLGTKHNTVSGALQHAMRQTKSPQVADQLHDAFNAHQMLASAHYFAAGGSDRAHASLAAAGQHIQSLEGRHPTGQAREALDAAKQAHASLTARLGGAKDDSAQRGIHADTAGKHHAVAALLAQGPSRGGSDVREQYVAAHSAHSTLGHAFQALADGDHRAAKELTEAAQRHVSTLRALKPSGVNLKQTLSKAQGGLNALRDHLG